MAIHEAVVYEGQKPTAEELADLERAARLPINFDDIPPMSPEEMKKVAAMARSRRAALRKSNLTIRIPQQTIDKAKELLGAGYTGVLRRLIVKAVDHPELLKDCL
ncbi:hypothetical protein [uncultured Selenomonas sp.]|uniref:hypothetical protein n=1 Tax=uncultured Selenomonas sp. TaxID=159275 RepID=UPI0025F085BB|nr:hypothetical protein [uncultured Selenomonas sp.]